MAARAIVPAGAVASQNGHGVAGSIDVGTLGAMVPAPANPRHGHYLVRDLLPGNRGPLPPATSAWTARRTLSCTSAGTSGSGAVRHRRSTCSRPAQAA